MPVKSKFPLAGSAVSRRRAIRVVSRRAKADRAGTLGQRLMKFAGAAHGLPRDLARNHDHYIHGAPKK
jgi:hypothetical protein